MRIPSKISGLGCRTTELIRPYDGSASQKLEHFAVGGDDHIGLSVSGESSLTPRITALETPRGPGSCPGPISSNDYLVIGQRHRLVRTCRIAPS